MSETSGSRTWRRARPGRYHHAAKAPRTAAGRPQVRLAAEGGGLDYVKKSLTIRARASADAVLDLSRCSIG